jgi:SPP1 gp7 family putative phage head morphogenesis protein
MEDVRALLEKVALDGGAEALDQLGIADDQAILNLVNARGLEYAKERAGELVTQVDDSTREFLRADVATSLEEGWSNDQLASAIADNYAFSDTRAETVARTETAFADVAGNLNAWRASGQVTEKQWIVSADACDDCIDLDGVTVALDEDFPGDGGDGPPLHPNCRCDVVPVLSEETS